MDQCEYLNKVLTMTENAMKGKPMDKYKIEIGDTVSISIDPQDHVQIYGEVKYVPCATGDAWHIWDSGVQNLYYVQQYHFMRLEVKGKQS